MKIMPNLFFAVLIQQLFAQFHEFCSILNRRMRESCTAAFELYFVLEAKKAGTLASVQGISWASRHIPKRNDLRKVRKSEEIL